MPDPNLPEQNLSDHALSGHALSEHALSDHALANRAYWTQMADQWVEPGRRSWEDNVIRWGIWAALESEVNALGDLQQWNGKDVIELGCGTAYFSAWMAKLGARPVGIDVTPAQLETAKNFQAEFGLAFPLIEASAEDIPLPDASFDLAISEYGASIWCDPMKWVPEAARLLRPGGLLVFLRNSTVATLCMPGSGPASTQLQRSYFSLGRLEWDDDASVEFHLPTGPMLRCLRENGFEVENFIEVAPPTEATENRYEYITLEWAKQWPSEEIWCARKRT
jgi:ubiquinone/menaquinone biosynthesis C-methylase UbiE